MWISRFLYKYFIYPHLFLKYHELSLNYVTLPYQPIFSSYYRSTIIVLSIAFLHPLSLLPFMYLPTNHPSSLFIFKLHLEFLSTEKRSLIFFLLFFLIHFLLPPIHVCKNCWNRMVHTILFWPETGIDVGARTPKQLYQYVLVVPFCIRPYRWY